MGGGEAIGRVRAWVKKQIRRGVGGRWARRGAEGHGHEEEDTERQERVDARGDGHEAGKTRGGGTATKGRTLRDGWRRADREGRAGGEQGRTRHGTGELGRERDTRVCGGHAGGPRVHEAVRSGGCVRGASAVGLQVSAVPER